MAAWLRQPNGDYLRAGANPNTMSNNDIIKANRIKGVNGTGLELKDDSGPDGHPIIDINTGLTSFSGQPLWHKTLMAAPLAILGGAGLAGAFGGGGAAVAAPAGFAQSAVDATAAAASGGAGAAGAAGATAAGGGALTKAAMIGKALTGALSGQAAGRVAEGNANISASNAGLNRVKTGTDLQNDDYRNLVRASLLKGVQDFHITPPADMVGHVGTVTGGLRPSAIANKDELAQMAIDRSKADLAGRGDPNAGLTGLSKTQAPTFPQANGAQNALGFAAPFLSLASLWKKNAALPAI